MPKEKSAAVSRLIAAELDTIQQKHLDILKLQNRELELIEKSQKARSDGDKEQGSIKTTRSVSDVSASPDLSDFSGAIKDSGRELEQLDEILAKVEKRVDHFTGQLLFAFEVSALGQKSFANAMEDAVRHAIAVLASEALVRAAMETAAGFASLAHPFLAPYAPLHFKAAALYAAVGAGAIGGAVAMGGSGGGGASGGASQSSQTAQSSHAASSAPQKIVINVNSSGGSSSDRDIAEAVFEGLKKAKKYGYS